jgi:hypothetical protein
MYVCVCHACEYMIDVSLSYNHTTCMNMIECVH